MSEILTERTRIVPFEANHITDIVKMYAEPDSNKFIEPLKGKSQKYYLERLSVNAEKNKENLQYWSVYHLDNDDFVGTMNLNKFPLTGEDQLGLHLSRKYWGNGYGFELAEAVKNYAFEEKELPVLHWVFELDHQVSKKLALKLGFEPYNEMMDGDCELRIYRMENDKI